MGGCLDAPTSELGLQLDTTSQTTAHFYFSEPGEYGVCFYVNASTMPAGQGSLPSHYLAWSSKLQVNYPVQSIQGGLLALDTLVNLPVQLLLTPAPIGGAAYILAGDLVRLVPDGENCTLAANATDGGIVEQRGDGSFFLDIELLVR